MFRVSCKIEVSFSPVWGDFLEQEEAQFQFSVGYFLDVRNGSFLPE